MAYGLGYCKNLYIVGTGPIGEKEKSGPLRFVTQNGALHHLPIFESYLHLLTRRFLAIEEDFLPVVISFLPEIPDKKYSLQILYQDLYRLSQKFRIPLVYLESGLVRGKVMSVSFDDPAVGILNDNLGELHFLDRSSP